MGVRHVEELFSAAYDDALTPAERRRYDEHMATCPECKAAADDFRRAIDVVHAVPPAQMPVRVVLPSTPPQVARRRILLPALPRPRFTPAWGATAMALAGVAAVVIVVRGHVGGPGASTTSLATNAGPGGARAAQAAVGSCPMPLAVTSAAPGAPSTAPAGFSNRVTVSIPERPGQQLVLATTVNHVSPGSQVLVFSALTSSGSHAAVIPCVSLHGLGAVAMAPNGTSADSAVAAGGPTAPPTAHGGPVAPPGGPVRSTTPAPAAPQPAHGSNAGSAVAPQQFSGPASGPTITQQQADAFAPYQLPSSLAYAEPTSAAVGNLTLQVVQIPAGLAPGTQLQLIALVPAGLPGSGDRPAIEAVLTLDVS
jgi:anti-sigma factor RsiW